MAFVWAEDRPTFAFVWAPSRRGLPRQYNLGVGVTASPAVANGVVFFASQYNNVYAFSLPEAPAQASRPPDPASLRHNPSANK